VFWPTFFQKPTYIKVYTPSLFMSNHDNEHDHDEIDSNYCPVCGEELIEQVNNDE